jgi:hypothetical protein
MSVEKRDKFFTVFCILIEICPEALVEHDFFDMYAIDIGWKEDDPDCSDYQYIAGG